MKKLLSLVMALVMALCLSGCGQNVPKADYTFSAEKFVEDCLYKHGNDVEKSVQEAEKFYRNKRIELKGWVFNNNIKDRTITYLLGLEKSKVLTLVGIEFRDEMDRKKFLEEDNVKLSATFKKFGCTFDEKNNTGIMVFCFDDGVFLGKY